MEDGDRGRPQPDTSPGREVLDEEWARSLERSRRRRAARAARRRAIRRRRATAVSLLAALLTATAVVLGPGGGEQVEAEGSSGRSEPDRFAVVELGPHKGPVPVLMYHVIGNPPEDASYPGLYVTAEDFEAQVEWLTRKGYVAVTLDEVEDAWSGSGELPPRPVVISFDDGYDGQHRVALPVLAERDWPGVLSLKAEGADLDDDQVSEMLAAGWELASHTVTHADLTTVPPADLDREVGDSKAMLEERFGVEVANFTYPAGRWSAAVAEVVNNAGYTGAMTTDAGLAKAKEPFALKRLRVDLDDGVGGLRSKLREAGA